MEKNTVETAENVSRERKFQEDRLEGKKRMALELEKRDSELSNDIAKVQGISSKADEFEINLFGKKEIEVNNVVDEHLEMEMEKSDAFRDSIRNVEVDNSNIFELQRRYHNGEVSIKELTNEQINALCDLYDDKIADLKKTIAAKEQILANYKKGNRAK